MWRINAAELAATREKIAAINERAFARGFNGRFNLTVEEVEEVKTNAFGFTRTEIWYDVALEGTPPKYEGWEFQAALDWDTEAGLIVRTAPGAPTVDRDKLVNGFCDHCRASRYRKETYLVRNVETGEQKQVGSTCIKDFLGWNGTIVFLDVETVESMLAGSYGGQVDAVGTDYALAVAWAVIKIFGYRPAAQDNSTKGATMDVLWPPNPMPVARRVELERIRNLADEAMERAKEVRAWVLSEDFAGPSDYVTNLKAVCAADSVNLRNIGLLASAPQAWSKRKMNETLAKSAPVSNWVGTVGQREEFDVTISTITYLGQDSWGREGRCLYIMTDKAGNLIKWFASRAALGEETGVSMRIKATVKDHKSYRQIKETLVTRVTQIAVAAPW